MAEHLLVVHAVEMSSGAEEEGRGLFKVTWIDAALALVVLVWAAGLVVVVVRQDGGASDGEPGSRSDAAASVPRRPERPTAEEIIDALRIETGFTVEGATVSYGLTIENTSDHVIRRLPLTYRFLDDAGEVISEPETRFSDEDITSEEVLLDLGPGERHGVGDVHLLGRGDVANIEVEVGETFEWVAADYDEHVGAGRQLPQGELTTGDITVSHGASGQPTVTFTVESTHDTAAEMHYANVVFRDASGQIVGGFHDVARGELLISSVPAGGSVESEVQADVPMEIPRLDASLTEVYLGETVV